MICLHSTDGYYIYMEASDMQEGESVRLVSPSVSVGQSGDARCLQFWFHMNVGMAKQGMGALRIFILKYDATVLLLWERRGDQRDVWIKETVTIADIVGPYKVSLIH